MEIDALNPKSEMHIFKVGMLQTLEKHFFIYWEDKLQVWSIVLGYLYKIVFLSSPSTCGLAELLRTEIDGCRRRHSPASKLF